MDRHTSNSNPSRGQPLQAAPPTDPSDGERPQDVESVIRTLIQKNNDASAWQQQAENTFTQHGSALTDLTSSMTRIERMLATLSGAQTPEVTSTSPSPTIPATPNLPAFIQSVTAHPTRTGLKPNMPTAYSGDRATGRAFLNSCNAYYKLRPDDFKDPQARIQWVLTFMNTDRAGRWANRIYSWESENPGSSHFRDWEYFVNAFKKEFFPLHPEQQAINQLESDGYWQRTRNMDTYIDEFRDLAREANYSDQRILVVKFRRGLKNGIQDEIATMSVGRPADDDLEAWINQARLVEQNQASNVAFKAASIAPRSFPPLRKPASMPLVTLTPPSSFNSSYTSTSINPSAQSTPAAKNEPPRQPASTRWAYSTPSAGNPVPMDIDASRRRADLPVTCYRCGKPGHVKAHCPLQHDVRHMSLEEARNHLEFIIARSWTETSLPSAGEEPEASAPEAPVGEEDFPPNNE